MSASSTRSSSSPSDLLAQLIRRELASIPIEQWGYFFPGHVAIWRFIEAERPGVLGTLQAGYDREPYFKGKGSDWFCGTLGNHDEYLRLLETIMYPLVDRLTPETKQRGFLLETEVPLIDPEIVRQLASLVLAQVDSASAAGLIR